MGEARLRREKFNPAIKAKRPRYYIVARDGKGRFLSIKRWTRSYNLQKARKDFKEKGAFQQQGYRISRLSHVNEIDAIGQKKPVEKYGKYSGYMYYILGRRGSKEIWAVSMKHEMDYPVREAREEALENFYYRYSMLDDNYDEGIGNAMASEDIAKGKLHLEEGIRYYVPLRNKAYKAEA